MVSSVVVQAKYEGQSKNTKTLGIDMLLNVILILNLVDII